MDTKAPALDLGLDSIVLLKRQGKSSVKNIVSSSSFLRTRPSGQRLECNGEARTAISGDASLPKLRAERQGSLKKSTDLGNPFAMERLAANDIIRSF